jgi:hypothetical protein
VKINDENYKVLNAGAFEKSKVFHSENVHGKIMSILQEVTKLKFE